MTKMPYPRPSEDVVREAIRDARTWAWFRQWDLKIVPTDLIQPRQSAAINDDIVNAMQEAPETVPPIVLTPVGNLFMVVDGHHRLAGAVEAEMDRIWAVVVHDPRFPPRDLRLLEWYSSLER